MTGRADTFLVLWFVKWWYYIMILWFCVVFLPPIFGWYR